MFPGLYGAQDEIARLQKYRMRKMDKCCAEVIYDQIRKRGMENVSFVTIMTSRQCTAHCSEEKIRKEGPFSTTAQSWDGWKHTLNLKANTFLQPKKQAERSPDNVINME